MRPLPAPTDAFFVEGGYGHRLFLPATHEFFLVHEFTEKLEVGAL